jgi:hypothetical protein
MVIPFALFALAVAGLAYVGLHKTTPRRSVDRRQSPQMDLPLDVRNHEHEEEKEAVRMVG